MAQHRIARLPFYQLPRSSIAIVIVLIGYFVLNIGLAFLSGYSPFLGVILALAVNLVVFLLLQPRWALPLYILLALPTIVVASASGGILSRLYIGNLLLALVLGIGLVQIIVKSQRKAGQSFVPRSLMLPLMALVVVGLASILISRIAPDPQVVYSFKNSETPLIVVNVVEMFLLLGLPIVLIIVPRLIRTKDDVKWIVRAFTGMGIVYALGTIFAGPLHLYSQATLLGNDRPLIFGLESSILGTVLVLAANITLGQALYASTQKARFYWWACTIICSIGVILAFGRSAWIALFLSVLIMLSMRLKNLSILLVILAFVLILFIPGVSDFFNPNATYGVDRINIAQDAITIWQTHPYFGIGAGNYQFFDIAYGTDVAGVAHNQYLEVLAEMGIPGLLCLLWSLLAIGWITFQRFKAATTSLGKAVALAYIGTYVTIIFSGFFGSFFLPSAAGGGGTFSLVFEAYFWLLLVVVVTIPQWEKAGQDAAESDVVNSPQATGLRRS